MSAALKEASSEIPRALYITGGRTEIKTFTSTKLAFFSYYDII